MSRAAAILLALGGVTVAALAAHMLAQPRAKGRPLGTGLPPPPPAPKLVQGSDGNWYEGSVGGKQVQVGPDGATINGTHFSLTDLGLTAATGGAYGSTKYYLAHPGELGSDLASLPGKVGDAASWVGGVLGF
jgi:hypothetical protein